MVNLKRNRTPKIKKLIKKKESCNHYTNVRFELADSVMSLCRGGATKPYDFSSSVMYYWTQTKMTNRNVNFSNVLLKRVFSFKRTSNNTLCIIYFEQSPKRVGAYEEKKTHI